MVATSSSPRWYLSQASCGLTPIVRLDGVEVGPPGAEVARVPRQAEALAVHPLLQDERAGADRMRV